MNPLLQVDLTADYPGSRRVLDCVRFRIDRGEIAGLIGPSGSGKSTVALAVLRLLELRGGIVTGSILFDGRELLSCRAGELRRIRGKEIGLVLQNPITALNPALRIETQLREAWRAHETTGWQSARSDALSLLARMGLPTTDEFLRRYPRQLSVGQAQRVAIAMAVLHRPKLLIADEPTSALDPESRGGIQDLFAQLNAELGVSILYVSHDLESVGRLCHSIGLLQAGRLVAWDRAERGLIQLEHAISGPAPDPGRDARRSIAAPAV